MIVLAGGKTGGHIMPLISISKELEDVCYVGASHSLEEELCKKHNIPFIGMNLKNNHLISVLRCALGLRLKKVDAILSTGGYVSFPTLLYGIFHHIPIYLLEENVIIGRTNRFFARFAKKVFLAFPVSKMKKKYQVVGIPTLIHEISSSKYAHFSYDVLILGGSLGSKPLCELVHILKRKYRVCLIASRYYEDYKDLKDVQVFKYIEDLPSLMLHSKIIISRAGAGTTYEIFSLGKPCILIPSQNTSQNHQYLNALFFEEKGCCKLLKESDASSSAMSIIDFMMENKEVRDKMIKSQKNIIIQDSSKRIIEEMR